MQRHLGLRHADLADWIENNIHLTQRAGAGINWKLYRWQRLICEAVQDHLVRQITVMCGTQLGKTTLANGTLLHAVGTRPEPTMLVFPIEKLLKRGVHDKLLPMIRDCPSLEMANRSTSHQGKRGPKPTLAHNAENIDFGNGSSITLAYSGSETMLGNVTASLVVADEFDDFMDPIGAVQNMQDRFTAYGSSGLLFLISCPDAAGFSPIEYQYLLGDQRRYWVPCVDPDCRTMQLLEWKNVQRIEVPGVGYRGVLPCVGCGLIITDPIRRQMIEDPEANWIAEKPFLGHASFTIGRLYSPDVALDDIVNAWKPGRREEQKFSSNVNGEPYQPITESELSETVWDRVIVDRSPFLVRPDGITAGVDVQQDRLEVSVVNWYSGEIGFVQLHETLPYPGDRPLDVFGNLVELLKDYRPDRTFIDLGYRPEHVHEGLWRFMRWHMSVQRAFGCRGRPGDTFNRPVVERPAGTGVQRYWPIATDEAKLIVRDMLENGNLFAYGPGIPDTWAGQMSAERLVLKDLSDGSEAMEWRPRTSGARNEALDCFVYAMAAYKSLREGYVRPERDPVYHEGVRWIGDGLTPEHLKLLATSPEAARPVTSPEDLWELLERLTAETVPV